MMHIIFAILVITTFLALPFKTARCHMSQGEEHIGSSRERRNAANRNKFEIWNPSGIPYLQDAKFPSDVKSAVENSIKLIEKNTCLQFKKRTTEEKYINFVFNAAGTGCAAGMGVSKSGPTKVTLSKYCKTISPVIHELIHALGFNHEHNRPDSLKYVVFNTSNVIPGMEWTMGPYGLDKNGKDDGTLEVIGPYDYKSIMQYGNFGMAAQGTSGFTIANKYRKDMEIGKGDKPTKIDYLKLSVYFKCPGLSIDYGTVKGQWGPWSAWTPEACPTSCGPDYQQRFRWCNGNIRTDCAGVSTQVKRCDNCAGSKCKDVQDTDFCTDYADCTSGFWMKSCRKHCKFCGQSCKNKMTDYYCLYYAKSHCSESWAQSECAVTCNACNKKIKVDGKWGSWLAWAKCSATCGDGSQQRTRKCDNPSPQNGGATCTGVAVQNQTCNKGNCPVHGKWGSWLVWTGCSVKCGGGTRQRTRNCDSPTAQHGGNICTGDSVQTQKCNERDCSGCGDVKADYCKRLSDQGHIPSYCQYSSIQRDCKKTCGNCEKKCTVDGKWGSWLAWAKCSATCGDGSQQRTRKCDNPSPQNGGPTCTGVAVQNQTCNKGNCPECTNTNQNGYCERLKKQGYIPGFCSYESVLKICKKTCNKC